MAISATLSSLYQLSYTGWGAGAIFLSSFFGVCLTLQIRRKRFRASRLDPFTDMPLRPPGESLRLKIEEISDEFDSYLVMAGICGIGGIGFLFGLQKAQQDLIGPFVLMLIILAMGYLALGTLRLQRKLWDYRVGYTGEQVVGEALNQLMRDGFEVFHDLPFEDFNIDHVIVGPPGLFVFETKAVRKPAEIKGKAKATVIYDGNLLHYPKNRSGKFGLDQADRNAKTVSEWLSKATGKSVTAQPILAIPGWWVERKAKGAVTVLNPLEIKSAVSTKPVLARDQVSSLAYQLSERCRMSVPV